MVGMDLQEERDWIYKQIEQLEEELTELLLRYRTLTRKGRHADAGRVHGESLAMEAKLEDMRRRLPEVRYSSP